MNSAPESSPETTTGTADVPSDRYWPVWLAPLAWLMGLIAEARQQMFWFRVNRRALEAASDWRRVIPALLEAEAARLHWLQHDALALIRSDPEFADIRAVIESVAPQGPIDIVLPEPRTARDAILRSEAVSRSLADPHGSVRRLARRLARTFRAVSHRLVPEASSPQPAADAPPNDWPRLLLFAGALAALTPLDLAARGPP